MKLKKMQTKDLGGELVEFICSYDGSGEMLRMVKKYGEASEVVSQKSPATIKPIEIIGQHVKVERTNRQVQIANTKNGVGVKLILNSAGEWDLSNSPSVIE